MSKINIGIDPGMTGAIAILSGKIFRLYDTPTLKVQNGKTKKGTPKYRTELIIPEMVKILKKYKDHADSHGLECTVWLEKVHSMPGQGVRAMFTMGEGFGIWQGIIGTLGIPMELVPPQRWKKKEMDGMGKEKNASVHKALQIFPTAELITERGRKLDGRADALLIAKYGRDHLL